MTCALSSPGLPEAHADALALVWRSQLAELSRSAINASLMVNQLVDMDWKFGVSVSSDEVDQVRARAYTFVFTGFPCLHACVCVR